MKFVTLIFFITCCLQLIKAEQQYLGETETCDSSGQYSYTMLVEDQACDSDWTGFENEEEDQDFHLFVRYIGKSAGNIHFPKKSIESVKQTETFTLFHLTWLRTRSDLPPPCFL